MYQELLTGTFPFNGKTARQLMLQHVSAEPDLTGLPASDQTVVRRALAKEPEERFGSCSAFVQALQIATAPAGRPGNAPPARDVRTRTPVNFVRPTQLSRTGTGGAAPVPPVSSTEPPKSPAAVPDRSALPPAPAHPAQRLAPGATPEIAPVAPVPRLFGLPAAAPRLGMEACVRILVREALLAQPQRFDVANTGRPPRSGDLGRRSDGTWACTFPSQTPPGPRADAKLEAAGVRFGLRPRKISPVGYRFTHPFYTEGWFRTRPAGRLEVDVVVRPGAGEAGEVTVTARNADIRHVRVQRHADDLGQRVIVAVRHELMDVDDRRREPRLPLAVPVYVYPLDPAGWVGTFVAAMCVDVSESGLSVLADRPLPPGGGAYVEFVTVPALDGHALLVRWARTQRADAGQVHGARFCHSVADLQSP